MRYEHEEITRRIAAGLTLAFAMSGSGCSEADAKAAVSTSTETAPAIRSFVGESPRPPFDETPITPVESSGASRFEQG